MPESTAMAAPDCKPGTPTDCDATDSAVTKSEALQLRREIIGPTCHLFFDDNPLMVMRGEGQYLYDEKQNKYLDCISNVQHVGHAHPRVAEAVYKQMLLTNCNNRFLHPILGQCAKRIVDTLPTGLDTMFACNSGSEANDLALRLSSDYTGGTEIIVLEHSYHGHLTSTMGISPYKFNVIGPAAKPDHVHVAPVPDVYRGIHQLPDDELDSEDKLAEMGRLYALEVKQLIDRLELQGKKLCAFIAESLQSCGRQVITPPHYLRDVTRYVRNAGGLVIIDEVQTGFGRSGSHFWAFETHAPDLCPDIVCMGKPMGNGFPVSAVVTRNAIGARLGKGVQYFNTFGGNPVSCAAVMAVMDIIRDDKLQQNAAAVGLFLLKRLKELRAKHIAIGDVRGIGLFAGVELVECRSSRRPAGSLAEKILSRLRTHHGILLSSEGPHGNVLKFKPPMCFTVENVQQVYDAIDECLTEFDRAL